MKMSIPNVITAFRLVLFAGFIFAAHRQLIAPAAVLFFFAWALDSVDGWLARRLHQETAFGFVFDKVVDRMVLVGGLFVLLVTALVPLYALLLIIKDVVLILPVVRRREHGFELESLGALGRLATLLQGAALLWLLFGLPFGLTATLVVAVVGVVVAVKNLG